ncbi:MAG: ABC transporter ATP-binding protein [Alphaproteobacteria bacterium]|nr:ABC transporter ATP-binding protein [Alphaproteobacteria bacterium]
MAMSPHPSATAAPVVLAVRDLVKRYGVAVAVGGIAFELHKGEVLTLLGHSGCGKSTTLRMAAGLEEPDGGIITLRGTVVAEPARGTFVPAERRNVGLVFQSYAVWPHMTVGDNIAYPLEVRRVARAEIRRRVAAIAATVGLGDLVERPATQLSGGQQQRVALARALVYEPDVLLLDEPFSNLDAKLRDEMRDQLRELQHRLGTTILYVTHDQTEAMALSHRVAVMRAGQIEQLGTPHEIYENPASFFVQDFVGRTVVFAGEVVGKTGAALAVRLAHTPSVTLTASAADGLAVGATARVACRPEDIQVTTQPAGANAVPATIADIAYGGDHFDCLVRAAGAEIALKLPKSAAPTLGQSLTLALDPAKVKLWRA